MIHRAEQAALTAIAGGYANTHDGINVHPTVDGGVWVGWRGKF